MESTWIISSRRKFKVEKIVGWYDVWTGDLPFSQFTVKVVKSIDGSYTAFPNVHVKSKDGIEYTCGMGNSIETAVRDSIERFYAEIEKVSTISTVTDDAFAWMCWTPFGPSSL